MKPYSNSTKLDKIVTVERQAAESGEWGERAYEKFFTAYAQVSDRAGGETLITSQNKRVSTAKTTFTFRATQDSVQINPKMRILLNGFVHEILTPTIFSDDRNFVSVEAVRRY